MKLRFGNSTENGQKWQVSNQPSNNLRVLSPSGEKFAERQDENIVIINRQSGEILTQTSSINQASVMQWSYDEQHLALIADRNSSIIIWDLKTNDLQTLRLEQELPNIENWVIILTLVTLPTVNICWQLYFAKMVWHSWL